MGDECRSDEKWWTQRDSNPRMTTTRALLPASTALGKRAPADTRRRASSLHPQPCVPNYFNCHRCYSATGYSSFSVVVPPVHQCALESNLELGVRFELTMEHHALLLTRQVQSAGLCEPSMVRRAGLEPAGASGPPGSRPGTFTGFATWANWYRGWGSNPHDPESESGMSARLHHPGIVKLVPRAGIEPAKPRF